MAHNHLLFGFDSRLRYVAVVQWLRRAVVIHEIRVQFPAATPRGDVRLADSGL